MQVLTVKSIVKITSSPAIADGIQLHPLEEKFASNPINQHRSLTGVAISG
jgi:hypothetical protein